MKRFSIILLYIVFTFFSIVCIVIMSVTQLSAQCNPNCGQTTNLNFSTGWDQTVGALINVGQVDPHWRLMNTPPLTGALPASVAVPNAYAITPFGGTWNVIPGSRPMSMSNQAGFGPDNADANQPWRFRRYFCVCEDTEVELIGQIKADDTGSLMLYDGNGNPMPFSAALAPAPNANNFNVGVPFSQVLFLPAGNYYFEFTLLNTNATASGFAVQGTMLSTTSLSLYDEQLGCCAVSVITGQKILDNDCDQVFDPTSDQLGVGFVFDLIDNSTGNIIATTQSDVFGEFEFNNVLPGSYTVRERQEFGWLGVPVSVQVVLGPLDVQTVTFFNCPYTTNTLAGCVYGDITANPTNIHNEKGLAIVHQGGFFNADKTHTFSSTNVPFGVTGDEHLIGKQWDNVSGTLQLNTTLNDFIDVDQGAHSVENLHVLETSIPCNGGTFAAVGTVRNGSNQDIFYAEYNTNGFMSYYTDITSTPGPDRERVHELIKLSNNGLLCVGTQRAASSFPSFDELIISELSSCSSGFSHHVFSFQDNSGQVAVTGRSVLELDTPLPGYPTSKYAVTGSISDKTYLLLLDASYTPNFAIAYDIDGNSNTSDEGIRIRREGGSIFILGNSQQTGFNSAPNAKIFLLKLGFLGQQVVPTVLANKLYDIPGGGERIVDADINFAGDIILTGVSALANSAIIVSGSPLEQKTFLMGLDTFGNELWLNQVLLQEGSEPADLQFRPLFDEINIVGTCWTNELVSNGGIVSNNRKFDEMFIRATFSGELAFNSICTNPLEALVSEPTPIISDFIPSPVTPAFNIVDGTLDYDDYSMRPEYCSNGQGGGTVDCDSVMITSQTITNPNNLCCYSLDYYNNSPGPLYELCVRFLGTPSATFSNISTDPNLTYTLNGTNTELKVRSAISTTLPLGSIPRAIDFCLAGATNTTIAYLWKDINGNVVCEQTDEIACNDCGADFTWMANCFDVQFTNTSTGVPPLTYAWDFDCDGIVESTLQDPLWTFPKGIHLVCLTLTDGTGSSCTTMQTIMVNDTIAPIFNCPSNITIPTDPGLCTAMYTPPISATDDCDSTLTITCTYTGATTGTGPITIFNKGVTTVTCVTEDDCGNIATCTFDITVVDNEPPQIVCPAAISTSVPACAAGSVVTFNPPTFTDNCPMTTYTCSHQSGDFFPCGTTMVTCTATDMSGNMTSCSFPVTVDCSCGELAGSSIGCGMLDDTYDFTIQLIDNTGSNTTGCTVTVTSPQSGVSIVVNSVTNVGPLITVTGTASIPAPPIPTTLQLVATMTCICPNGPVTCSFPTNLVLPCCKSIFVDSTEYCKTTPTISIPLGNCNTLHDVTQVRWYVSDAPCQPLPWTQPPFKIATTCDPLLLEPRFHTGDVCIYVEVDMGSGAGPCRTLTSNVGFIKLCEPISCSVNNQEHCYVTGTPFTPAPLTASINPSTTNCSYTIQWWDENVIPAVPIPGATGLIYQPSALSYTGPASGCNQDYFYKAVITTPSCGVSECMSRIRLHHNDAPVGTLDMNPLEPMPFCPGEDATLEYTSQCAGSPKMWDWSRSTDNVIYTPIPSNGTQNSLYNTNRLYQDTWVRVTKQNGTCPADEIDYMIDVYDPLMITNFTAVFSPPCDPTDVAMQLDFKPDFLPPSTCDYTISWYRDGTLLSTTVSATSPVSYTHSGTNLGGNYYAIIQSNCCPDEILKSPVITLDPPMEVALLGPCFRCNCDTISLTGIVLFPPGACTFEWFDNGVLIPWATTDTLTVYPNMNGPFEFKVTCGPNNCMKSAIYNLLQCGSNDPILCDIIDGVENEVQQSAQVFPNPTNGHLEIAFENPIERDLKIEIVDVSGRIVQMNFLERMNTNVELDISRLADGIYFIQAMDEQSVVWREKIIKQ